MRASARALLLVRACARVVVDAVLFRAGPHACEIFLILFAFKLADPCSVFINRGPVHSPTPLRPHCSAHTAHHLPRGRTGPARQPGAEASVS